MKPNIAEVCFSRSWGGLEHYVALTTIRLVERGFNVSAVTYPASPLTDYLRKNGIDPVTIRAHDYFSPIASLRMAMLFRNSSISSLHLHRTQDLAPALFASDLSNVRNRLFTLQMESARRKRDIYHRWVYNRLTNIVTITERARKLMVDNVTVDPSKVSVLYYGIDIDKLRQEVQTSAVIREKWKVPDNAFVIGLVGRIEPSKGQEVVIRAAASLTNKIPQIVVMFVGDETVGQLGERDRLEKIAKGLSPNLTVIFTGYLSPPGNIVPAFDVSILASRKETFGLVVIEAQAIGIPVIGTNAGGVPEIITNNENGLLVPPSEVDALASAIQQLYDDTSLRKHITINGSKTVEKHFSLDVHMKRLIEILGS